MPRSADEFDSAGIDPFIDAYEAAQARDGHARLADYLPDADHPLYLSVLCELVRVDLEYGWMRGTPRTLEEYRAEYPCLFRDPERVREVAFEESRLRRQAGDQRAGFAPEGGSLEVAARLYRRHRGGGARGLAEAFASYGGPAAHSTLFLTLHESDPASASRLAEALTSLPEPGTDFGGFRLIRELGRGAFGRVYLARQGGLADRLVALKVSAELPGETEALAQLQHTHIVPIYSAHRIGGLRALCMPYLGTSTLADVLRTLPSRDALADPGEPAATDLGSLRGPAYVRAVLEIGARLADGLAHAHGRGIVHRDLKPANILLAHDGQPVLLDFNLAADTKAQFQTAAAMTGGTLPYMAPEQLDALRGEFGASPADVRGDVFSLGLILHELLTGRHPFPVHQGTLEEVLARMAEDRRRPPPSAQGGNPDVSPATDSILKHCMEPDPAHRYQEAGALREDLQRQLEDRPLLHAADPSLRERVGKWARRHPRLSSGTTLGLLALGAVAALAAGYAERQRRFGPIEAAHALRQLADAHEEAAILALDPRLCGESIAVCRSALGRYGIPGSPVWRTSPLFAGLPEPGQAELQSRAGELLLIWARALALEASGAAPERRSAILHQAIARNQLAESCFAPGLAPRALLVQRAALARLAGDPEAARQSEERARTIPLRSARDYALVVLEDPDALPPADVVSALGEASRRDPRDFPLWMILGHLHGREGRLGAAEDCYTIAIVLRPSSPWPYYHRGLLALARGDRATARLDLDQALRIRPDRVASWIARGLARLPGDAPGALEDFDRALALDPRSRAALQNRASILSEHLGRTEEAVRVLDRVVDLYPDFVPARVGRGVLLARAGQTAAAHRDADESRRLDPASVETAYRIACIYALTSKTRPGDQATALRWLAEAFRAAKTGEWIALARTDPDLASLRNQAEFRALLRESSSATPPDPAKPAPRTRGFSPKGRTVSSSGPSLD